MRLGMVVWLNMLGALAFAGCQSSHPTTNPSGSDDCDCCKTTALRSNRGAAEFASADAHVKRSADVAKGIDAAIQASAFNIEHSGETAFLATRADVDGEGAVHMRIDTEQGSLEDTRRPLDVGIQGDGFFKVRLIDSIGSGFAYSRNGNFFLNGQGELVLGAGDGNKLEPAIKLPNDAVEITISQSGIVEYKQPGNATPKQAGQILLSQFVSPQNLVRLEASGLYVETSASGAPIDCKPGEEAAGITLQGFLEVSNVNIERERLRMEHLRNWRDVVRNTAVADAHP